MRFSFSPLLFIPVLSAFALPDTQIPMTGSNEVQETSTSTPSLADLLTIESSASIFYSYARELPMSKMLSDEKEKMTILVPTNRAVMALARKPHQGPSRPDEGIEISEEEFDRSSKENVQRWVSAHIIPKHPIELEGKTYQTLLDGIDVSFKLAKDAGPKDEDWQRVVVQDDVKILNKREGSNGVLYIIDGTIVFE